MSWSSLAGWGQQFLSNHHKAHRDKGTYVERRKSGETDQNKDTASLTSHCLGGGVAGILSNSKLPYHHPSGPGNGRLRAAH